MSGGKETPRQKMIGMMYLVLTALLALQVSNSVLEKFIFIDQTLREQVTENVIKNGKTLGGIEAKVKEKGDREADVKALDRAKEVREITTSILEYLDAVRETMVEITGGRDENGHMLGAKDYDKVGTMMVHGPTGKELKEKLNTYAADLSKLGGEEFIPLARDAKDIEIAKHDPEQNMKPFAEYYFEHTPTAAGMATISFMETEITNYEQKALENIAALVGAKDISFDQIYPIVLPVSNIVAAGTKFEGSLFITAASSAVDPTMAMNRTSGYPEASDAEVEVVDGKGIVSFTATPGAYNKDGLAEKKFMTYITMNDSTYEHEHIYFVAKPVIQIQSAAISSLYRNCGNELLVTVPALGQTYNPGFKLTGANNHFNRLDIIIHQRSPLIKNNVFHYLKQSNLCRQKFVREWPLILFITPAEWVFPKSIIPKAIIPKAVITKTVITKTIITKTIIFLFLHTRHFYLFQKFLHGHFGFERIIYIRLKCTLLNLLY